MKIKKVCCRLRHHRRFYSRVGWCHRRSPGIWGVGGSFVLDLKREEKADYYSHRPFFLQITTHRQTRDSYCERGFCVEPAAVCGVRCDRRVVGQWERLWRCRDSTLERTRWGSEGGCCGEVPAGRDHEGSGRTERVWMGKPSTQTVDRCANFNILYKIRRNKLFNNTGLSVIKKLLQ